ncbi:hypothetical protein BH23ACT10_BH23ACT10_26500 [soil metagenome]
MRLHSRAPQPLRTVPTTSNRIGLVFAALAWRAKCRR